MAILYGISVIAAVAFSYCALRIIYNLFLSLLARIPGRKLAALSTFYEWYWDCIQPGRYSFKIMKMHKELGEHHFVLKAPSAFYQIPF